MDPEQVRRQQQQQQQQAAEPPTGTTDRPTSSPSTHDPATRAALDDATDSMLNARQQPPPVIAPEAGTRVGAAPGSRMTAEQFAHAAVLEQMSHGATYGGGRESGHSVTHGEDVDDGRDRRAMLEANGYDPEPQLISGENGFQMVVYRPLDPDSDVQPVVSFRGTEPDEAADLRTDFDPVQVGNSQYEANEALIDSQMRALAEEYGEGSVEMTGHSLGGSLAQIAAARHPEAASHITTFQSPGVAQAELDRIDQENERRAAAGLPPLSADHFRVGHDIVPSAGDGLAPGTLHETEVARVGDTALGIDPLHAHQATPVTDLALATPEGQRALPGFEDYRQQRGESVVNMESHEVDNSGIHVAEEARREVGTLGRALEPQIDRTIRAGDRVVENEQAAVATGVDVGQRMVDREQRLAQGMVDQGQGAVDRGQRRVQHQVDREQALVDQVQGRAVPAAERALGVSVQPVSELVDDGQAAVGDAVRSGQRAVDRGQQVAADAVREGQRVVDRGQRTVQRTVRRGQQLVDDGQQAVHDAWAWMTD